MGYPESMRYASMPIEAIALVKKETKVDPKKPNDKALLCVSVCAQ